MSTVIDEPFGDDENAGKEMVLRADLQPLDYKQFMKSAGLAGEPITAEALVGKTFDILRAHKYDSAFEGQDYVWFCIVRVVDETELREVSLGGQTILPIIDAYSKSGMQNPLRVTLQYKQGGKFGGYYFFE